MEHKKTVALGLGVLVFWLLGISIFWNNLGSDIRFFNDIGDRSIYALDGKWYLNGQVPYRDTMSEYPQIPTYLFAVPYLLFRPQSGEAFNFWLYCSVISFIMVGFLFSTIILLSNMLPVHKDRAFLMLLPATLYFTYNRFDILPSFLVLFSLFFLQRQKSVLVGIILGIATMTKWYPALLLPVFLSYIYNLQRRFDWRMFLAFGLTCLAILTPTFLSGGLKAVLVPYIFHANRGPEFISLPALLNSSFSYYFRSNLNLSVLDTLFLILSVLPVPISVFVRVNIFKNVVLWSALILVFFILFSRIWSAQWILWVLPLMILVALTPADIVWIVSYGVVSYLAFPVIWDLQGPVWLFKMAGLAGFVILIRFAVVSYFRADGPLSHRLTLHWGGRRKREFE